MPNIKHLSKMKTGNLKEIDMTITKTSISKVVEFDEMGYTATLNGLNSIIKVINEKPVESNDRLSVDSLKRNGVINESFRSSCVKLGLTPTSELLQKCLNKNDMTLSSIITEEVMAELNKQNIHDGLKLSLLKSFEASMSEFAKVILRLNSTIATVNHSVFISTRKPLQIEKRLTFVEGLAIVSDDAKDLIREVFTTRLDNEARQEAFDLLAVIADTINQFNATVKRCNLFPMTVQADYLSYENDLVTPNNTIIKYF